MSLDDLKGVWQRLDTGTAGPAMTDAEVLAVVTRSAAAFDRTIRRRDRIEIAAAIVVSAIFLPLLWTPSWVVRAGVVLYMVGAVLTCVRLRGARQARIPADPTSPLATAIRAELAGVRAQIRLLESVLWWYIAPLGLGVILIFAGHSGLGLMTLGYTVIVVGLCLFIYRANQSAVRRDLRPRRDHLERLLDEVTG